MAKLKPPTPQEVYKARKQREELERIALLPPGLYNHGNTCFMNSVLQGLIATRLLADLVHFKPIPESIQKHSSTFLASRRSPQLTNGHSIGGEYEREWVNKMPIGDIFLGVMYKSWDVQERRTRENLSPKGILHELGQKYDQYLDFAQQDAHEFLRILLDAIRMEELDVIKQRQPPPPPEHKKRRRAATAIANSSTPQSTPTLGSHPTTPNISTEIPESERLIPLADMIFGGRLTSILVCQKCKHVSQTYEDFNDISLSIKPEDYYSHRKRDKLKNFAKRFTSTFPSTTPSSSAAATSTAALNTPSTGLQNAAAVLATGGGRGGGRGGGGFGFSSGQSSTLIAPIPIHPALSFSSASGTNTAKALISNDNDDDDESAASHRQHSGGNGVGLGLGMELAPRSSSVPPSPRVEAGQIGRLLPDEEDEMPVMQGPRRRSLDLDVDVGRAELMRIGLHPGDVVVDGEQEGETIGGESVMVVVDGGDEEVGSREESEVDGSPVLGGLAPPPGLGYGDGRKVEFLLDDEKDKEGAKEKEPEKEKEKEKEQEKKSKKDEEGWAKIGRRISMTVGFGKPKDKDKEKEKEKEKEKDKEKQKERKGRSTDRRSQDVSALLQSSPKKAETTHSTSTIESPSMASTTNVAEAASTSAVEIRLSRPSGDKSLPKLPFDSSSLPPSPLATPMSETIPSLTATTTANASTTNTSAAAAVPTTTTSTSSPRFPMPNIQRSKSPKPPKPTPAETEYLRQILADVANPSSSSPFALFKPLHLSSPATTNHQYFSSSSASPSGGLGSLSSVGFSASSLSGNGGGGGSGSGSGSGGGAASLWLGGHPLSGIEECLRMFTSVEVLDGENMVGCRRCWKIANGVYVGGKREEEEEEEEEEEGEERESGQAVEAEGAGEGSAALTELRTDEAKGVVDEDTDSLGHSRVSTAGGTSASEDTSEGGVVTQQQLGKLPASVSTPLVAVYTHPTEGTTTSTSSLPAHPTITTVTGTTGERLVSSSLPPLSEEPNTRSSKDSLLLIPNASSRAKQLHHQQLQQSPTKTNGRRLGAGAGVLGGIVDEDTTDSSSSGAEESEASSSLGGNSVFSGDENKGGSVVSASTDATSVRLLTKSAQSDGSPGSEKKATTAGGVKGMGNSPLAFMSAAFGGSRTSVPQASSSSNTLTPTLNANASTVAKASTALPSAGSGGSGAPRPPVRRKSTRSKEIIMRPAYKRYLIDTPPPVLVIHLKRFQHIAKTPLISFSYGFRKLDDYVTFPEVLDLTPFLAPKKEDFGLGRKGKAKEKAKEKEKEKAKEKEKSGGGLLGIGKGKKKEGGGGAEVERCVYRLYAVVVHIGNMLGGHYIAYTALPDSDDQPLPTNGGTTDGGVNGGTLYNDAASTKPGPQDGEAHQQQPRPPPPSSGGGRPRRERQWAYISDTIVRLTTLEEVMKAKAYLCMYERI